MSRILKKKTVPSCFGGGPHQFGPGFLMVGELCVYVVVCRYCDYPEDRGSYWTDITEAQRIMDMGEFERAIYLQIHGHELKWLTGKSNTR